MDEELEDSEELGTSRKGVVAGESTTDTGSSEVLVDKEDRE